MDVVYRSPIAEAPAPPAIPFVREVANLYHRNAWLFLKILLPAACFGWLVVTLSWQQAAEIQRYIPHGPEVLQHKTELWEAALFRWFGFGVDWFLYCFAFAAMSVAVAHLDAREKVFAEECFRPVRERIGGFVRLTIGLGFIVALFLGLAITAWVLLILASPQAFRHLSRDRITIFSMCISGFFLWGATRFGLAMPILIFDGGEVRKSLTRSYRLTTGCWSILALLLLESVGGSYLAYMIPLWTWRVAFAHGFASMWMWWLATTVGLLLGVLLQPHMFVGFALLYLRRTKPTAIDDFTGQLA